MRANVALKMISAERTIYLLSR